MSLRPVRTELSPVPRMEEYCFVYLKTPQGQLVPSRLLQNGLPILPI